MKWYDIHQQFDHARIPALCAELWAGDPNSVTHISTSANIVYRFESGGEGRYLRITHGIIASIPGRCAATDYLLHVYRQGVPVCRPVESVNGNLIETFTQGEWEFQASVVAEVPGVPIALDTTDMRVFEAWGQSMGKLHYAVRDYTPTPDCGYTMPTIQYFWENARRYAPQLDADFHAVYREVDTWLRTVPMTDYGLTHGDHRPGNVLWDGQTAYTVDFDEPVLAWYLWDIIRALLEFSERPVAERRRIRDAFWESYRAHNPIDEGWLDELVPFTRFRATLMHLWTLSDPLTPDEIFDTSCRNWALNPVTW